MEFKDNLRINLNISPNSSYERDEDIESISESTTSSELERLEFENSVANSRCLQVKEEIHESTDISDNGCKEELANSGSFESSVFVNENENLITEELNFLTELPNLKTIEVKQKDEFGAAKYLKVAILNLSQPRQFCGGYKNKFGVIFFNASSQTEPRRRRCSMLNTRDTQSCLPLINKGINTMSNKSAQVNMGSVYIPQASDKIVCPRRSTKNKLVLSGLDVAAITIQKFLKRIVIMKKHGRQTLEDGVAIETVPTEKIKRVNFRMNDSDRLPKDDLSLKRWKNDELKSLKEEKSGFAYKAAVVNLQATEIKCLLEIERRKIRNSSQLTEKRNDLFLETISQTTVRRYPKGCVTFVDDLNIQRAREFKNLYALYKRTDVPKMERMTILSNLKNAIMKFPDVDLTYDPIELIDREVDYIGMNIAENKMDALRRRFETLFMSIALNSDVNPQARKYKHLFRGFDKKRVTYRCESCGKAIASPFLTHFMVSRFKFCGVCKSTGSHHRSSSGSSGNEQSNRQLK